jgi:hypothetical protein
VRTPREKIFLYGHNFGFFNYKMHKKIGPTLKTTLRYRGQRTPLWKWRIFRKILLKFGLRGAGVVTYPHTKFFIDSTTTAKFDFLLSDSRALHPRRGSGVVWGTALHNYGPGGHQGRYCEYFHKKKFTLNERRDRESG